MRREHIKSAEPSPNYLLYMPLIQGDLTDHVSGGSVVQNGNVSWNSNVGAYEFRQSGRNSDSQTCYVTNLDLPLNIFTPQMNFYREYEIYPMTSSGGIIRSMSHSNILNRLCLNSYTHLTNTSNVNYCAPNTWNKYLEKFTGQHWQRYINGVLKQEADIDVSVSVTPVVSTSKLYISAGSIGSDYTNVKFCLKNLKIWRVQE